MAGAGLSGAYFRAPTNRVIQTRIAAPTNTTMIEPIKSLVKKADAAAGKSAWAFEQMKEFAMRIPDHSEDCS